MLAAGGLKFGQKTVLVALLFRFGSLKTKQSNVIISVAVQPVII